MELQLLGTYFHGPKEFLISGFYYISKSLYLAELLIMYFISVVPSSDSHQHSLCSPFYYPPYVTDKVFICLAFSSECGSHGNHCMPGFEGRQFEYLGLLATQESVCHHKGIPAYRVRMKYMIR